jgi:hypothetical protein
MPEPLLKLTPEKALIFRITHRANLSWILQNGLHCGSSAVQDPEFVSIGNPDLIEKRKTREVPIPPGGTLADYIPFYFSPFTPMLYNIHTGWAGIPQRRNEEIVILVSSLPVLEEHAVSYVFTNRHAYQPYAEFFNDRSALDQVDYELLQNKDFRVDPEDPGKKERYQAEALVHEHLPTEALLGVCCYSRTVEDEIRVAMTEHDTELRLAVRQAWYFR